MAQMPETWAALSRQRRPPPPRSQDEINAVKKQTEHDPWKMTTPTRDHDRDDDTKDINKDDITTPPPQDSTSFTG